MTTILKLALTETEMKLLRQSAALDCRRVEEQAWFLLRVVFAKELEAYAVQNNIPAYRMSKEEAAELLKGLADSGDQVKR
jgi:hypothetical protein